MIFPQEDAVAVARRAINSCPSCDSAVTQSFYEVNDVPVHSMLLMTSKKSALSYPKRDIALAFCHKCGFIFNRLFDPSVLEYGEQYEETQGFSNSFNRFSVKLVEQLIERYDLRGRNILEIGCGKGEFLTTLCEIGGNRGIGFDPAFVAHRHKTPANVDVTFVNDFFSEKYADCQADFLCCKMTLEHIPNPAEFVEMVRHSLNPGSATLVFFCVPNSSLLLKECAYWDVYYEHCSYFTRTSLSRLFTTCNFDILDIWTDFEGQYLLLTARPGNGKNIETADHNGLHELSALVSSFTEGCGEVLSQWQAFVERAYRDGQRTILWGSGSKAASFLTTMNVREAIDVVVDINPFRQGTYIAGTGQQIVAPEFLKDYRPDNVIIMNPIYCQEIDQMLREMSLHPAVFPVDRAPKDSTSNTLHLRPEKKPSKLGCRFCDAELRHQFVDLGMSPLCESYLTREQLHTMEPFYPLVVHFCDRCFLVQIAEFVSPEEIFGEYAYYSSYSDSWVEHARDYVDKMIQRFQLDGNSRVIEIASNDGYLLQHFVAKGIPVFGIEPAANVAQVAIEKGISTYVEFFSEESARRHAADGTKANLVLGNNILAQVPDLNGFVSGLRLILDTGGVITLEFPHLARLVAETQFDTIYHEHFSYFSLHTVEQILSAHGLSLFDVEELPTHGGSLRVYACLANDKSKKVSERVAKLREQERADGLLDFEYYSSFAQKVNQVKYQLLEFLIQARRDGKRVAGYGAPGKGNTLLNYCGIRTEFIDYTVDRNPYKQGKFLPGTHIPIFGPDKIRETRPDYVLILPWNLKHEIMKQLAYVHEWGGQFVVAIPTLRVYGYSAERSLNWRVQRV